MDLQGLLFGEGENNKGGFLSNIGPIHIILFFLFVMPLLQKNHSGRISTLEEGAGQSTSLVQGIFTPEFFFKTEILMDKLQLAGELLKKSSKFIGPEKASLMDLDNIAEAVEALSILQNLMPETVFSQKTTEQMSSISTMVHAMKKLAELNKVVELKTLFQGLTGVPNSPAPQNTNQENDESSGDGGLDLGKLLQLASLFTNTQNNEP